MVNNNRVQFDEPMPGFNKGSRGPRQSWPTKLVMKLGLAKDTKQATVVLIAVAVLAVIVAFIFFPRGSEYELVPQPGLGISYLSR
ncbi:hypothetical protein JXR01_01755 [Candidatus Kaiserbacteria bacterium]|nr:MAG: hypothetical protein JXR01_01755 [Candidatus Kaiserbacteria bacterium]